MQLLSNLLSYRSVLILAVIFCSASVLIALVITLWCIGPATLLGPPELPSTSERFQHLLDQSFELNEPLHIYWNDYEVPYVKAATDHDAFWGLGFVQAHLRLGQMELYRQLVQGRLSDMVGPFFASLDRTLRLLDIDRSAEQISTQLPSGELELVQAFVAGINAYKKAMPEAPFESHAFPIDKREWTPEDVVRVSRLASVDFTWIIYASLLSMEDAKQQADAWELLRQIQDFPAPPTASTAEVRALSSLFDSTGRFGSNSAVVSGLKTMSGKPLILSDPHLGITTPNFWVIAGLYSPSFNVVGLMIPGTPFFALGRNRQGTWGGTNLRAISSYLIELTPPQLKAATTRSELIKNRWWFDEKHIFRDTEYGPIITDSPLFHHHQPLALHWLGHQTDGREFSSFLNLARVKSWAEFRENFRGYRVPGLAMLYAGTTGDIGAIYAYAQPIIEDETNSNKDASSLFKRPDSVHVREQEHLPFLENPNSQFIISCNNDIFGLSPPLSLLPPSLGRATRLTQLLERQDSIDVAYASQIQQDTYSESSAQLKHYIIRHTQKIIPPADQATHIMDMIKEWDSHYTMESQAALAFEHYIYLLFDHYVKAEKVPKAIQNILQRSNRWKELLAELLQSDYFSAKFLLEGLRATSRFVHQSTWGDFHRYRIQTPLGQIPILGRPYRFLELPAPGTNDSINKTGGIFTPQGTYVPYGSQARHISDLGDLNANYFALLGGQDGWLKSPANTNQVTLWQKGEYIRVPLDPIVFARQASLSTTLRPIALKAYQTVVLHGATKGRTRDLGSTPSQ